MSIIEQFNSIADTFNEWFDVDAEYSDGHSVSFIDKNKKNIVLFIIVLLVGVIGMYLVYGEETEVIISNFVKQMEGWIGGVFLGSYLTPSGQISTTKSIQVEDVPVDINEMISL